MPELPEVETIKKELERKILGKKIVKIEISERKMIKNSLRLFLKYLKNKKFIEINRIGKLLIFSLVNDKFLLIHLKMTGQLVYKEKNKVIAGGHEAPIDKYTRIIFIFNNKGKLLFNDLRKFGYLKIVEKKELEEIKANFGIEPGTKAFTLINFKRILANKKAKIKSILLNQKNIAGIGNIYADEILYEAKIRPTRIANSLTKKEVEKLFKTISKIIKKAIKWRGTTFNNYRDGLGKKGNFSKYLKVYKKDKQKCPLCKGEIKRIKLNGRGTHFCPKCQR